MLVKNPALAVAEKASEQILKYANSLGLTPAAWKRWILRKQKMNQTNFKAFKGLFLCSISHSREASI